MRKRITNYSYAELSLVFKEYFDISKITETLNIQRDSRTLGWIGGAAIACAAGVVCAGIAYRNRRKHNG